MSFTNNVYGGVPQSELVFSTTNISSDNASFINLSVSDSATITNLTTVNWSQPNLNASTVVTTNLVVTNTSAVNLDVSGVMNVSDLNISDLNVSDISVSTLNVGDIVIDEAEVTTLRFDDVTNANYSEIQRDNDTLTIAGGYVNGTGTQFNGDIAFTPYNLSNATPPSMVVQASDGKVYIPNMSSLDINTSNISVATLMTTNQLTATGLAQFQSTLAVVNPTSQTQNFFWNTQGTTAFQLGNLATVDFNIGNDASNPNKGIIVRGGTNSSVEIPILTADNLSSTLANISTLNVSTINIADIDVPLINTSQLNASNISVDVDLKVVGRTETDILQADTLAAGCDMTSTLETSTDMYYPNNLLIDYSATQIATTVELSSNLSLNDIELLPDLVTTAVPTFSMLSGTAQITNANISTLTCDLTPNLTAGFGISITSVGGKPVIANTGGSVTDPLNLSKLNASNISCDGDITTDTITCDLTPNLTAGAGVTITSVANKPTIAAVNSVSANVSVSDFIETLQIIPSGTNAFPSQGIGQGSQLISVYDFQGGTAYTAANLFTVNAGDKIHFNWKQSGWVQTSPGQQSYVICYIVKGTNAIPQAGDRIEVGRIYQYIYSQSDHEEITGSFVYNVTSTFSFYRSQMEGASNLVTQGQDYGAATATVYRATIPNSISVPTLINATNISVDNLSVITSLTAPLANISLINASDLTSHDLHVSGGIFTSDNATVFGNTSTATLTCDLTPNIAAGVGISVTSVGGIATITNTGGSGSTPDPLNLSQLNSSNIDVDANITTDTLTCDLTPNLTAGSGITIVSVGGKPTITATGGGGGVTDPLNISKLNASNISVDLDVTIGQDLNVQRYLDQGKPRFMMLARTTALGQTGAGERTMVFNTNSTAQVAGEFGVTNGGEIQVSTGGWYRLSWSIGFIRASGGDRYSFRSYNMTKPNGGSYSFDSVKDRIGSIGYCRSSSLNRECSSVGSLLRYIPANGWVRIVIGAMIQSSSNFSSSFNGTNLRASSNFMIEFVSSASET